MKKKSEKQDGWMAGPKAAGPVLNKAIRQWCINAIFGAIKDGATMTNSRWAGIYVAAIYTRSGAPEPVTMKQIDAIAEAVNRNPDSDAVMVCMHNDYGMKVYARIFWRGSVNLRSVRAAIGATDSQAISKPLLASLLDEVKARGDFEAEALPVAEQFIDQYLKKEDTV